jgi:dihydropteroate synthase
MGVLNVTPDSFSDGGKYVRASDALRRAEEMLEEGATFIDVGGESSRPSGRVYGRGAEPVTAEEEIGRVAPVVESIAARLPEALISIDTSKAVVARAALEAGAHIVNDITGFRADNRMPEVVAEYAVPVILMHSRGRPGSLAHVSSYENVVESVCNSLMKSIERGRVAGVHTFILDPGFGFGKSPSDNLRLIRDLGEIRALGHPIAIGISRKSTIGSVLGTPDQPVPIDERLPGSLGATALAVLNGASIVRTHDVRETARMLRVIHAIRAVDRSPSLASTEVNA